jgi:hypothetical protein
VPRAICRSADLPLAALTRIWRWDFWSPSHQWNDVLIDVSAANPIPGGGGIRAFAMMNVALQTRS